MPKKFTTVQELAQEADADLDEAIVTLWDVGIEYVEAPTDRIAARDVARARTAMALDDMRSQRTVRFWLERTGLGRQEFTELLAGMGLHLSANARTVPKGAVRRLRRQFAGLSLEIPQVDRPERELPPFEWRKVGRERELAYLSEEDVLQIHYALVDDFAQDDDPISPPGVKSPNLLSSAVHRPQTGMADMLKYPTVEMAGAALTHSLGLNHAFHNGNKRTAIVALVVFLDRNGFMPCCSDEELFRMILRVAQHRMAPGVPFTAPDRADRETLALAQWIRANARPTAKGERPVQWHRLRRLLRNFDCDMEQPTGVGNRMNIWRTATHRGVLGRERTEELFTQVQYSGEGQAVQKNTLNKIRRDLKLDEGHGVDSRTFYEADSAPGDFIQQYRGILRRLGKL